MSIQDEQDDRLTMLVASRAGRLSNLFSVNPKSPLIGEAMDKYIEAYTEWKRRREKEKG